ncbi:MAG: hypothetical protein KGY99_05450 [Phycisphaerae bacterium]|jgi:hypothetical protein|nr:hypothetical protein [Phycisphaerae bacterium]
MNTTHSQNITLIALTLSAALLAGLLVFALNADEAEAGQAAMKGDDYMMITIRRGPRSELLCVIDMASRRMSLYEMNTARRTLDMRDRIDLEDVFRKP